MTTKMKRVLTLVITVCMLFSAFGGFISTTAATETSAATKETQTSKILQADDIPANMSLEEARNAGHVSRLYEQESPEDLSSVIFKNADGTNTMYIFSEPVKYIAPDGTVKDKKTALISSRGDYKYVGTDNDVITKFSERSSGGVSVDFDGYTIIMVPEKAQSSDEYEKNGKIVKAAVADAKMNSENEISYEKVFGNNTILRYTPQLNGVKEEIILNSYNGQNEFAFVVKTNGLAVIKDRISGRVAIYTPITADSEKAVEIAYFSSLYIFDATKTNTSFGETRVEVIKENQEYLITLVVDKDYLENKNTVYPVTVDPSINFTSDEIKDTYLTPPTPDTAHGFEDKILVGGSSLLYPTTGNATALLALSPGLVNSYANVPGDCINNAYLYLNITKTTTQSSTVTIYENTGVLWNEGSVTYGNYNISHDFASISNKAVTTSTGSVQFNIASAIISWKTQPEAAPIGIILSSSSTFPLEFASTDNSSSSLRPYISINFSCEINPQSLDGETLRISSSSNKYLTMSTDCSEITLQDYRYNSSKTYGMQVWHLKKQSSGLFKIYSLGRRGSNNTMDYVLCSDAEHNIKTIDENDPTVATSYYLWNIILKTSGSSQYIYFRNNASGRYLILDSGTLSFSRDSTPWIKKPHDMRPSYYAGWYAGYQVNSKVYFKIQLDSSLPSSFQTTILNYAKLWENYSNNIAIYLPNETVPNNITPIIITFRAEDLSQDITTNKEAKFANTSGLDSNGVGTDLNSDWY
ncbi:MAG: hypothetical protein ACI4N6_01345, partial [Eubacteriales bacterium]